MLQSPEPRKVPPFLPHPSAETFMTMMMKKHVGAAVLGILGCFATTLASAQEITGAGSTAIYPALSKWAEAYQKDTGVKLNYQSIGYGGGIQQIEWKPGS